MGDWIEKSTPSSINSMALRPKKSPSSKRKNKRAAVPSPTKVARKKSTRAHCRKPRPAWVREFFASLRPGIERKTQLMPWLVADSVVGEACCWLNTELPPEWADWLDARAERCFARRRQFHRLVSARNAGLGNLYKFMRHWLASRIARARPELFRRLPFTYALGVELDLRNKALDLSPAHRPPLFPSAASAVLQTAMASASVPAAAI